MLLCDLQTMRKDKLATSKSKFQQTFSSNYLFCLRMPYKSILSPLWPAPTLWPHCQYTHRTGPNYVWGSSCHALGRDTGQNSLSFWKTRVWLNRSTTLINIVCEWCHSLTIHGETAQCCQLKACYLNWALKGTGQKQAHIWFVWANVCGQQFFTEIWSLGERCGNCLCWGIWWIKLSISFTVVLFNRLSPSSF